MESLTGIAANGINNVVIAIIKLIDGVVHLERRHRLLQATLQRTKDLLRGIGNRLLQEVWYRLGYDQSRTPQEQTSDQITPPETIRDCLLRTQDIIEDARHIIYRSQPQQRCLDCLFCRPTICSEIREWNTRSEQLLQDLQTQFSTFPRDDHHTDWAAMATTDRCVDPGCVDSRD